MKTTKELGAILKDMYENAPENEKVVMIHLFGIQYGPSIMENNLSKKDIIQASGIPESYLTELSKGIKLSQFVEIKD